MNRKFTSSHRLMWAVWLCEQWAVWTHQPLQRGILTVWRVDSTFEMAQTAGGIAVRAR